MLRGRACTGPVVDVDARDARHRILVDEHQRQLAADQPVPSRRLELARVHERTVQRDVAGGDDVVAFVGGEQRQRQSGRGQLVDDGTEEARCHLVGERVGEGVGEQNSDRAGRSRASARAAGSGPT